MRTFLKLNILSLLYGCMIAIPSLLIFNISRINRLMGLGSNIYLIFIAVTLVVFILGAVLGTNLTDIWLKGRVISFCTVLLWFPYCLIILWIFGLVFPITNEGLDPGPGAGFLIIGVFAFSPIILILINLFGIGRGIVEEER
ncbi:hypothetical protein [Salibacterium sp. K-3]